MGKKHEKFMQHKHDGTLLSPDTVGKAVAGMALCRHKIIWEYNGKFVNWDENTITAIL